MPSDNSSIYIGSDNLFKKKVTGVLYAQSPYSLKYELESSRYIVWMVNIKLKSDSDNHSFKWGDRGTDCQSVPAARHWALNRTITKMPPYVTISQNRSLFVPALWQCAPIHSIISCPHHASVAMDFAQCSNTNAGVSTFQGNPDISGIGIRLRCV